MFRGRPRGILISCLNHVLNMFWAGPTVPVFTCLNHVFLMFLVSCLNHVLIMFPVSLAGAEASCDMPNLTSAPSCSRTLGHCSWMFGSGSPPAPDSALSEQLKLCPEGMVHDLNNLIFNFVFPPARTRSSGTILPQRRKLQPDPSSASVQESNPTDQIQHSQAQPSQVPAKHSTGQPSQGPAKHSTARAQPNRAQPGPSQQRTARKIKIMPGRYGTWLK